MKLRDSKGKFKNKSKTSRKIHSIRATDEVWSKFGTLAKERNMTRADLLEIFIEFQFSEKKIKLLEEALNLTTKLRSNSAKIIREKISQFLENF